MFKVLYLPFTQQSSLPPHGQFFLPQYKSFLQWSFESQSPSPIPQGCDSLQQTYLCPKHLKVAFSDDDGARA